MGCPWISDLSNAENTMECPRMLTLSYSARLATLQHSQLQCSRKKSRPHWVCLRTHLSPQLVLVLPLITQLFCLTCSPDSLIPLGVINLVLTVIYATNSAYKMTLQFAIVCLSWQQLRSLKTSQNAYGFGFGPPQSLLHPWKSSPVKHFLENKDRPPSKACKFGARNLFNTHSSRVMMYNIQ